MRVTQNGVKFGSQRKLVDRILGTFDLIELEVFGVTHCTCLKIACNSKAAVYRAKPSEIWVSGEGGTSRLYIVGTF